MLRLRGTHSKSSTKRVALARPPKVARTSGSQHTLVRLACVPMATDASRKTWKVRVKLMTKTAVRMITMPKNAMIKLSTSTMQVKVTLATLFSSKSR